MTAFDHCTLVISARSPFARRVRVAFIENGVDYNEKVIDVFNPPPELKKLNPLLRVPLAILKNGQVIVDSSQILQAFYGTLEKSPAFPQSEDQRELCFRWSGIAVGLCEKMVEYYLETLRPKTTQDDAVFKEIETVIQNVLGQFEQVLSDRSSLIKGLLTQADFDMGTALDYMSLRHPMDWKNNHPKVADYLGVLQKRPSFEMTKPPPA